VEGTAVLAAQRISMNALSLSFLPGLGFGIATTALVGMSVGARRVELGAAAAGVAARWAVIWMGAVGAIYFVLDTAILSLFTNDAAVIEAGGPMLRIIACVQPMWAVGFVYSGALRGLGNTRFPLFINTGGVWAIVTLAFVLLRWVGTDVVVAWLGWIAVCPIMAALAWWQFSRTVAGDRQAEARAPVGPILDTHQEPA